MFLLTLVTSNASSSLNNGPILTKQRPTSSPESTLSKTSVKLSKYEVAIKAQLVKLGCRQCGLNDGRSRSKLNEKYKSLTLVPENRASDEDVGLCFIKIGPLLRELEPFEVCLSMKNRSSYLS